MQGHESGRCIHTSYFSSPSLCWCSASPTGADTPWPTATTPPDQPTTPTPASLVLVLGLVGETSVSRVLETSVEELVIGMASALRDSFAQTVTGIIWMERENIHMVSYFMFSGVKAVNWHLSPVGMMMNAYPGDSIKTWFCLQLSAAGCYIWNLG